ncbi:hypothetical protein K491DRAFT_679133 [Lophiostoma macrostomum CBS 122681]|uniref:Uncharacterized protein n=1 Tax=Lophiostoma macrostomum CBS 122681 TaxID=1314788 RepID=A0A6A6T797_9PLEO|nr:hypothetical protein K491DRAFT_679133 [Lophiostoma macrostomum CBS 122681]
MEQKRKAGTEPNTEMTMQGNIKDGGQKRQRRAPNSPDKCPRLPPEIWKRILEYYFNFPKEIHSKRWPWFKSMRVDKLLHHDTMFLGSMALEAVYSNTTIVVEPIRNTYAVSILRTGNQLGIVYPSAAARHWVRRLEFRFNIESKLQDEKNQGDWLSKLASGALGFQKLKLLRFDIEQRSRSYQRGGTLDFLRDIHSYLGRQLQFKTAVLEITVGHKCRSTHVHSPKAFNLCCDLHTEEIELISDMIGRQ